MPCPGAPEGEPDAPGIPKLGWVHPAGAAAACFCLSGATDTSPIKNVAAPTASIGAPGSGTPTGTITFTGPGGLNQTVAVNTVDDTIVEGPEDYTVSISGQSQGGIVAGHGQTNDVIVDNDGSRLQWSIVADTTVTEGTPAVYTVGYDGVPLARNASTTRRRSPIRRSWTPTSPRTRWRDRPLPTRSPSRRSAGGSG